MKTIEFKNKVFSVNSGREQIIANILSDFEDQDNLDGEYTLRQFDRYNDDRVISEYLDEDNDDYVIPLRHNSNWTNKLLDSRYDDLEQSLNEDDLSLVQDVFERVDSFYNKYYRSLTRNIEEIEDIDLSNYTMYYNDQDDIYYLESDNGRDKCLLVDLDTLVSIIANDRSLYIPSNSEFRNRKIDEI